MAKKSIKKNYIFNLIYQLTLIIVPLIVTPYVSRVLLADGIGKYSFSVSIITYFLLFSSLGFELYAQREIAKYQDDKSKQSQVFWEIVVCRCFFVAISLLANLTLIAFGVYGKYTLLMKILSINIIAIAFDIAFFFQGNENFAQIAIRNLIIKMISTALVFLLVKTTNDLWIYAMINMLAILVGNISLWPMLTKNLSKFNKQDFNPFAHVFGTLKLFLPTIAVTLYTVIDKTMIGIITKADSQNGYYEQAEKIVKLSMTLITCLGAVMAARNSYEFSQKRYENVQDNTYKSINFVWVLGLPMLAGIVLVSNNIIPWFLGGDFLGSIDLLKIFAPLVLIIGFSNVFGAQYMIPCKKDKAYTISIFCGVATNLVLNIPLIYFFGAVGAAIATVAAETSIMIVMLVFVRKELSVKKIFASSWKPAIASAIMFGAVFPWARLLSPSIFHTLIIIAAAIAVYAIAVLLLREPFVLYYAKHFLGKFNKKKQKTDPSSVVSAPKDDTIEEIKDSQKQE